MAMTLGEMIETLQSLKDQIEEEHGEDAAYEAPVRLAVQPSYPIQHAIGDMALAEGAVYIAEEGMGGDEYLSSAAREELGW